MWISGSASSSKNTCGQWSKMDCNFFFKTCWQNSQKIYEKIKITLLKLIPYFVIIRYSRVLDQQPNLVLNAQPEIQNVESYLTYMLYIHSLSNRWLFCSCKNQVCWHSDATVFWTLRRVLTLQITGNLFKYFIQAETVSIILHCLTKCLDEWTAFDGIATRNKSDMNFIV